MIGAVSVNGNRLNISASVEPDGDGDNFGDETQDLCPTNALFQTACPAAKKKCPKGKKLKKVKGKKKKKCVKKRRKKK